MVSTEAEGELTFAPSLLHRKVKEGSKHANGIYYCVCSGSVAYRYSNTAVL